MEYNQVIDFLHKLDRFKGIKLGLKSISSLLEKLGNPHKELKVIHVAGTNGKGSVCAMLSSMLSEAGYKVGMYTSPHLNDFRERFLINNKKITKEDVVKYFEIVKEKYNGETYFEFVTAMAFLYFKDKKVDFLVLEVGLGGRLDATNVAKPLVSVITNISLEHTNYLGKSIEKVAYEKAGIIKQNVPVVTGAKNEALKVIKKACDERNSKLFLIKNYKKINDCFDVNNYKNLKLNLKGDFQLENAGIAVSVIDVLNLGISKDKIKDGLKKVIWLGRLEFIDDNVLVDCGHNPAAFLELKKEIKKLKFKKLILVIGILKDKDIKNMVKIIEPLGDKVILTKPKVDRASELVDLAQYFKKECVLIEDSKEAFDYAKKIKEKDDLVLVTGSIYLVGEVIG